MTTTRSRSSTLLEPPPQGVQLEGPGANDSASDSEMDHFSDASEGRGSTEKPRTRTPSPVPRTRVEKVDDSPRYGEVPGSPAYLQRASDAVPDEVEVVGDRPLNKDEEAHSARDAINASPVPRTVVEKIDPSEASYGETPGTSAYEARIADSAPDSIIRVGQVAEPPPELVLPGPVPETLLSRVETPPDRPGSATAHRRSPSDALPDAEEMVPDAQWPPTSTSRSDDGAEPRAQDSEEMNSDEDDDQFGDDFDTFEVGAEHAEHDDFGDFDDAFEEPTPGAVVMDEVSQEQQTISSEQTSFPSFPLLLNFDSLNSLSDLMTSTTEQLDTIFPKASEASSLPPPDPVTNSSIFTTDRSVSLWSQLVAPPPLQPPNWTKSRIRRLFLVSLGVPVDLDEILPASKQKKLVLPSINLDSSTTHPDTTPDPTSKSKDAKSSQSLDPQRTSTSSSSRRSTSRNRSSRRRRHPSPPQLDLTAVHRLCATTDAALDGFTDEEMQAHVKTLEDMATRASEVLEYWLKRRDEQMGEKEAFEGVIENLVKHARQVRK